MSELTIPRNLEEILYKFLNCTVKQKKARKKPKTKTKKTKTKEKVLSLYMSHIYKVGQWRNWFIKRALCLKRGADRIRSPAPHPSAIHPSVRPCIEILLKLLQWTDDVAVERRMRFSFMFIYFPFRLAFAAVFLMLSGFIAMKIVFAWPRNTNMM